LHRCRPVGWHVARCRQDALASFDHALALDPQRADAYVGKGDVLNRLECYQEALVCFDRAASLQRKSAVPAAHALA